MTYFLWNDNQHISQFIHYQFMESKLLFRSDMMIVMIDFLSNFLISFFDDTL